MSDHPPRPLARRSLLGWLGGAFALPLLTACSAGNAAPRGFAFNLSEAEWRRRLTPAQFRILRGKGTEYPGTSSLLHEHRRGIYACAGDGHPLFASAAKYDSRTGWPSFWRPLPGAIATESDRSLGQQRTEVHCARCGGHLGHVFDDGPRPTGKRYCINGTALAFRPA